MTFSKQAWQFTKWRGRGEGGVGGGLVSNVKWNSDRITFFESIKAENACHAGQGVANKIFTTLSGRTFLLLFLLPKHPCGGQRKYKYSLALDIVPPVSQALPCPSYPCLSFQFSSFAWLYLTPPATPSTWGWAHNLALSFNASLCGTGLSHIFMLPIHPLYLLLLLLLPATHLENFLSSLRKFS